MTQETEHFCNYPDGPCFECETEFALGLKRQKEREMLLKLKDVVFSFLHTDNTQFSVRDMHDLLKEWEEL